MEENKNTVNIAQKQAKPEQKAHSEQVLGKKVPGEKPAKKKVNLRDDFLIFSCVAMGTLVLCIYLMITSIVTNFDSDFEKQAVNANNLITDSIYSLMDTDLGNEANKPLLQAMLLKLTSDGDIKTIIIRDNETNTVYLSNVGTLINKTFNASNIEEFIIANGLVESSFGLKDRISKQGDNKNSHYSIFVLRNETQSLINSSKVDVQIKLMFLIALFFALVVSFMQSRRIIKPLHDLTEGARYFAQGKFNFRLKESKYKEINDLVQSYNSMAGNLQSFYVSLDKKVKNRTAQLEQALKELKNAQSMMVHSEKMKSLGGLVAGLMHEINNPVNFIYGNLIHLNNYSEDLISLIDSYSELDSEPKAASAIKIKKDIDYEFLKEDLPALLKSCKEGTERTKDIIQDLKNFSRLDANVVSTVDLPKEIETTLNILSNKFKNKIEVHKEYTGSIPTIEGHGSQLNQVFMNILDNAAFAIKEKGDVFIRLNTADEYVLIEIEDNGCGMSADAAKKIFEPFYTTKPVGQGTGLGMSISYKVIKTHSGEIEVISKEGVGTKFKIKLPIEYTPNEHALAR